jgi:ubiquinone/menaquinone biosynthesis C-methylase UbiE
MIPPAKQPLTPVDLESVKKRQQATWASGDFSFVAARIVLVAEELCEAADLQAGERVLDVATGSGNAALAAARRDCRVTGIDYVPALLERGRLRAEAERLEVDFQEGDAEKLPFEDESFDAVLSVFGVMFAPDHKRAAAELVRVCRRGGKIALASWTPGGFIGEMFRLVSKYVQPVAGLAPPVRWGDQAYLRELLGGAIRRIESQQRNCIFRYTSAEDNVAFMRRYFGPTLKAFSVLSPPDQEKLAAEMAALNRAHDRNGGKSGPVAIVGEYLETVIVRA